METKELDFVVAAVVVVVQRATDLVVDQLLQHTPAPPNKPFVC